MRDLSIVLSAGVLAALLVYALISVFEMVGMLHGDVLTMRLGTLIGIMASMGFGAAGFALLFRWLFARADTVRHRDLEHRLARLEGNVPRP